MRYPYKWEQIKRGHYREKETGMEVFRDSEEYRPYSFSQCSRRFSTLKQAMIEALKVCASIKDAKEAEDDWRFRKLYGYDRDA